MNNDLVSIIIPVYNVEKFLRKCLDSVANQTYSNLEIILVDDGSRDGSGAICDEFAAKDNRFVVFHNKNNGVSYSRNFGLSKSSGSYICFIDSDDYIHCKMVEFLVAEISRGNYSFSMVTEQNVTEEEGLETSPVERYSVVLVTKDICIYELTHDGEAKRQYVHLLGKLYKREFLSGLSFREDISLSEDLIYNLQFYLRDGNGVHINVPMYFRTLLRSDSLSTRKPTDIIYNAGIYLYTLSLLPNNASTYRDYIISNIINRVVRFRLKEFKTDLREMSKTEGKKLIHQLGVVIKENTHISLSNRIKYFFAKLLLAI